VRTITVNVSEPVYEAFREHAKKLGRKVPDLICEAMELYRQQQMQRKTSLRNRHPASVGGPIQALPWDEDRLGEMLDDRWPQGSPTASKL
jgi:hypothetical protein